MIFQLQEQINQYKVIRLLGAGGMSEVYLVEEDLTGRLLALKTLYPHLTQEEQFRERFVNEARILGSLRHNSIVQLHGFFIYGGAYCMAMEYIEGGSLKDLIRSIGPIPEERALNLFHQTVEALAFAHAHGIIHRDVKPSNIMVAEGDRVKVMDFGIAKMVVEPSNTRTGSHMGTLVYMSPEQVIDSKKVDGRSDIYSLGATLFEMLSGRPPYNEQTESNFAISESIVYKPLPDPRQHYAYISDQTITLLQRITAKKAEERPDGATLLNWQHTIPKAVTQPAPANTVGVSPTVIAPEATDPSPVFPPSTQKPKRKSALGAVIILFIFGALLLTFIFGERMCVKKDDYYDDAAIVDSAVSEEAVEETKSAEILADSVMPAEEPKPADVNARSVSLNNAWLEHNVFENSIKGMRVHVDFECYGYAGSTLEVSAYFYLNDGTPLKDYNGSYKDTSGNVSSGTWLTPSLDYDRYSDHVIFVPYDEMHINSSGRYDLKAKVSIFHQGSWQAGSDWLSFQFNKS